MAQFLTWLRNQQDRNDAIGRLAMAADRDQEFPRANKLNVIVDYLKSKGANDKLLDTVENAYAEFENNPRSRAKPGKAGTPAAAPAPDPKPRRAAAPDMPKPAETRQRKEPTAKTAAALPEKKGKPAPAPSPAPTVKNAAKPVPALPTTKPARPKAESKTAAKASEKPVEKRNSAVRSPVQPAIQEPVPSQTSGNTTKNRAPKPAPSAQEENRVLRRRPSGSEEMPALPDRLQPLYRQLADASAVLDAQFGRGFAKKNPAQVLEFARMLLTADQNRMLHFTFTDLAEALHRVAGRLESMLRQPY